MNFEDIPNDWKWKRLGDVCEKSEYGYTTSAKSDGEGPLFLRTTDISNGKIHWDIVPFCAEPPLDEERYRLKDGDILIARAGSVGAAVVIKNPPRSVFASYLIRFRPREELNSSYAGFFLKSNLYWTQLDRKMTGTTIPGVNATNLSKVKIPLPPLPTQKKIAAVLEKAEKLREWRKEADGLTDALLKSTFLEMFGDPMSNPKGWTIKKLHDFSEIVSGVTRGRKIPGNSVVLVPYLRVANVQDGYLDLNEIKTIEASTSEVEEFSLLEGDVLLTEGGDPDKLGRGAIWHEQIPNCIHQNHIFRVRVNKKIVNPEFLSVLIGSVYGKMYFLKAAKQTTGIATINSTQLKNFPAFIPPLPLQQKFAHIVQQVEQIRQYQEQSKQQIDDFFNVLMQKAFNGELEA